MIVYLAVTAAVFCLAVYMNAYDYEADDEITYFAVGHRSKAAGAYFFTAIVLILVAGLRYGVGADFFAYYGSYKTTYINGFWDRLADLDEPGIGIVFKLGSLIKDDPGAAIFSAAALTIIPVLFTLYRNTDRLCPAVLLYLFYVWTSCFNGMRQALAAAIIFCGFAFLRDRRFVPFAITVIIAFFFHRSCILLLVFYFFAHRKVNVVNVGIFATVCFVILLNFESIFNMAGFVLDKDLSGDIAYATREVNIMRTAMSCAPAVFFLAVYAVREKTEEVEFYLNCLLFHAYVAVATSNSAYFARMSMYTAPFVCIAIPELFKRSGLRYKRLWLSLVILLYGAAFFYEINVSPDLFNWKWVWER